METHDYFEHFDPTTGDTSKLIKIQDGRPHGGDDYGRTCPTTDL